MTSFVVMMFRDSGGIIHEEKVFFDKKTFCIENQYAECQDGEIEEIALKDFSIVDYAGVLS